MGFTLLGIVLMLLSVPLFFVFGVSSAAIAVWGLGLPSHTLMQVSFDAVSKQVLVAIPIFVFAGNIMYHGGSARRLVDLGVSAVGHLPGGLGIAMILSIAVFSAISGSILASIVAIGSVLMKPMVEAGYPKPFVIVLAATAALMDALIPPSNTAIIYSSITHVPVSKAFSAGVLPGLLLGTLLLVYVMWTCRRMDRPAPQPWGRRIRAFVIALPSLLLPVLILGGLYGGLLTPAESASLASVYALALGMVVYRELTWSGFWKATRSTAETTAVIFAIIAMAVYFSIIMTYTKTPQAIVQFFIEYNIGPITFMILAGIAIIILGTFMEAVPIFYLTLPIMYPISSALKIDPLHFYVFITGLIGLGLITPPVCVGVYVAAAILKTPPQQAFSSVPGFFIVGIIYSAIVMLLPWLSTWLPRYW
ncbi:MAG TPA: TRAP transporter large permease [Burkholderiales bacterium]|nr:TRAP transporter large permease [Burkholderiales bacterium]